MNIYIHICIIHICAEMTGKKSRMLRMAPGVSG